ncbi:MAG: protein-L-isoaspartate(D-aspartate) O-methyltransferase [Verrucomicrobia bacterium]|nr:protein-L-isoaspartate(D-aspartate) O-methyltransferase [Verrucomicrobiota bacterium]
MHAGFSWVLATMFPAAVFAGEPDASRSAERNRMVDDQISARGVVHEPTLAALRKVPRHLFVPVEIRSAAYQDSPLPIGHGQTISQPFIVAAMTEAAAIARDSKVLEIGTGSGYQAAIAAELSEQVFSIEIVPALAARAAATLKTVGYERVNVRAGDGYHGWPEHAPFDVIIVTAAADSIPPPLVAQLKDGGRMLIPVGPQFGAQNLVLVTKQDGRVRTRTLMPVRFVPFTRAVSAAQKPK